MALTRKFLTALGVEAEKIDEIISAHSETVEALKDERDSFKADAEKYASTQKELDDLKKQVSQDDGENPYEVKYNAIKEEFEKYKADIQAKAVQRSKEDAYRKLLKEAGVSDKRIETVLKVSGDAVGKIEFDDDGAVKGADDLKKQIGTEWADFIVTESVQGANVDNPPDNSNSGDVKTTGRAAQIAAKYHENLYGKAKED